MEGGAEPEHRSDVEAFTYPPDPLTNASHAREVDDRRVPLLPFLTVHILILEVDGASSENTCSPSKQYNIPTPYPALRCVRETTESWVVRLYNKIQTD